MICKECGLFFYDEAPTEWDEMVNGETEHVSAILCPSCGGMECYETE